MILKSKLIIAMFMISVLPVSAVGLYEVVFFSDALVSEMLEELDSMAGIQKARINDAIDQNFERMEGVASRPQLQQTLIDYLETNSPDEKEKIKAVLNHALLSVPDFKSISVLDSSGNVIVSTTKEMEKNNFYGKPLFEKGKISNHLDVGDYGHTLHLSGPLILDGKVLGVLFIESNANTIEKIISDYTGLHNTGETLLASRTESGDAMFITPLRYSSEPGKVITSDRLEIPITHAMLKHETTFDDTLDYNETPVLSSTRYIEKTDWGLVVKVDKNDALHVIAEARTTVLVSVSIAVIFSIFVTLYVSKQFSTPIHALRDAFSEIRSGIVDSNLNLKGSKEFEDLGNDFNSMLKQLNESNDNLKTLNYVLDQMCLVSSADKNGKITSVNDMFCKISGYSEDELIGKNHRILNSGYHDKSFFKNMMSTISSGNVWKGDIRNISKTGKYYWVKTIIAPIFNKKKEIEKYVSIRTEITKNKINEETIRSQFTKLKEVDKLKEEFIAMVSHELKTPLTPISLWAGALKNQKVLGPLNSDQLEAVDVISESVEELNGLISDIFDSYKLDLQNLTFSSQKIDIIPMIDQALELSKKSAEQKNIVVKNTSENVGIMYGDSKRITQVLNNLIINAIDFVHEGTGVIEVNASDEGNSVLFYVKDNGIGIPYMDQKDLFKKFYQVDTSVTRKHGGSGLGLSICHGMIDGMGGKIWVESEVGQGATFYFLLPKKKPENTVDSKK